MDLMASGGQLSGATIMAAEATAHGLTLLQNITAELSRRNLAEVKTEKLIDYSVKLVGMFAPRVQPVGVPSGSGIQCEDAEIEGVLEQMAPKE